MGRKSFLEDSIYAQIYMEILEVKLRVNAFAITSKPTNKRPTEISCKGIAEPGILKEKIAPNLTPANFSQKLKTLENHNLIKNTHKEYIFGGGSKRRYEVDILGTIGFICENILGMKIRGKTQLPARHHLVYKNRKKIELKEIEKKYDFTGLYGLRTPLLKFLCKVKNNQLYHGLTLKKLFLYFLEGLLENDSVKHYARLKMQKKRYEELKKDILKASANPIVRVGKLDLVLEKTKQLFDKDNRSEVRSLARQLDFDNEED